MPAADDVADELYGLLPGEFVAARDAAVRQARADGDRDAAADIAALRKPTTTAWLVNLLVRNDEGLADQLRALGEGLRDAEATLAGDELTALDKQRRQLVAGLVTRARALAREHGQRVTQATGDEVHQTLLAALADPDVADDVLSGRLTHAREHVGFGAGPMGRTPTLGLVPPLRERKSGSPAVRAGRGSGDADGRRARDSGSREGRDSGPGREDRAAREARERAARAEEERLERARQRELREDAEVALREVEKAHGVAVQAERDAATDLGVSRDSLGERAAEVERLAEELARLTALLEAARDEEQEATRQVSTTEARHRDASRALRWAARDLEQAQRDLDDLT